MIVNGQSYEVKLGPKHLTEVTYGDKASGNVTAILYSSMHRTTVDLVFVELSSS
jgi:hypothetical protein